MKKYLAFFIGALTASALAFGAVDPSAFRDMLVLSSIKIGGTGVADSKAALEINSTTKGFLQARLTATQRDAISSPPVGLSLYNSTTDHINFYNGIAWVSGATIDGIETLTNKTFTAPTITDFSLLTETTAPATPASGFLAIYAKSDHVLYQKTSAGTETPISSPGGLTGAVQFNNAGALGGDDTNFYWDNSTKVLKAKEITGTQISNSGFQIIDDVALSFVRYKSKDKVVGSTALAVNFQSGDNSSGTSIATDAVTVRSGNVGSTSDGRSGDTTIVTGANNSTTSVLATGDLTSRSGNHAGLGVTGAYLARSGNITNAASTAVTGSYIGQSGNTSGLGATGTVTNKSGNITSASSTATTGAFTDGSGNHSNTGGGASGTVTIASGTAYTTGALTIRSGVALNTSGGTTVSTGTGPATGAVLMSSGNGSTTSGNANLQTGTAPNTGNATLSTGNASVTSGSTAITTGTGVTSGSINFGTGVASTTATFQSGTGPTTGDVIVASGNASVTSGNVSIFAGTATTTQGDVTIISKDYKVGTPVTAVWWGLTSGGITGAPEGHATGTMLVGTEDHPVDSVDFAPTTVYIQTGDKTGGNSLDSTGVIAIHTGSIAGTAAAHNSGGYSVETGSILGGGGTSGGSGQQYYKTGVVTGSGNSGIFTFETGSSVAGNTGGFSVLTGAATAGNSGGISLVVSSAGTTQGTFQFLKIGQASVAGQVWTATNTNGDGYWAAPVPAQGTLCGWYDSVGMALISSCIGVDPNSACPAGYTQRTTTGAKFCTAN